MFDEFPLDRAEHAFFGYAFDCGHAVTVRFNGQYQT
jgi:hypothetical protein